MIQVENLVRGLWVPIGSQHYQLLEPISHDGRRFYKWRVYHKTMGRMVLPIPSHIWGGLVRAVLTQMRATTVFFV